MDKKTETMELVCARVPPKVYAALDCVRRSERRTLSQVVRNILDDWYQEWWTEQTERKQTDDPRTDA